MLVNPIRIVTHPSSVVGSSRWSDGAALLTYLGPWLAAAHIHGMPSP
jgi:hypothetical protein